MVRLGPTLICFMDVFFFFCGVDVCPVIKLVSPSKILGGTRAGMAGKGGLRALRGRVNR
jgi:hypothetical protein